MGQCHIAYIAWLQEVQSLLQCNNWILTTWKAKNVAIYHNILQCAIIKIISIFFSSRIVLYCSNEYCNNYIDIIIAILLHPY